MKDIIIINSVYDKSSREFVASNGDRSDVVVINDDGYKVRLTFPYISAFPTVIIPTPTYQISSSISSSIITISASIEYIRAPENWNTVQERIDYWENKVPNWKQSDSRYTLIT